MKRLVVFLMIAGLTTMFMFGQKMETRTVSNFTGINASGAFDITIVKGATESLTLEADDQVMQYVHSEVKNGVLHLYLEKDAQKKVKKIKTLKATVVMRDFDKVNLSGACKITANDLFTSQSFSVDCSGSSNMTINVNTGQLNINTSGASKIQIMANVTGNTQIDASGSSKVNLIGSANNVLLNTSGASKFKAEDFVVRTATINSSGACDAMIHVTDALNINSSGASNVNYKGSPAITIKSSGASKVKRIQ